MHPLCTPSRAPVSQILEVVRIYLILYFQYEDMAFLKSDLIIIALASLMVVSIE